MGDRKVKKNLDFFLQGMGIHLMSLLQRHHRVLMASKELWIKSLNVKYDST